MSRRIKSYVYSQICHHLKNTKYKQNSEVFDCKILSYKQNPCTVHLPTDNLDILNEYKKIIANSSNSFIVNITEINKNGFKGINLKIDENFFLQNIIEEVVQPMSVKPKTPKKIVIDFSSPNIAKPFHIGHLRSTIIGNFIANINEYLNEKVVRINYLGDWGTQFGLLKVGIDLSNYSDDEIKKNPIQLLYNAYVQANNLAQTDDAISTKAKQVFSQLESGKNEDISKWQMYKDFTVEELKGVYKRLGITFDEYHWESMYGFKEIESVIKELETKEILYSDDVGRKYAKINDKDITVIKSDGSTLYLTRDIAAVLDRHKKYSFDEMLYVVDNAQTDHFSSLFEILNQMNVPFKDKCKHIKFGRVRGMSTRKGNIVFLKDILDEAKEKMRKQQIESINTKVNTEDETIQDILGASAVIINDLKQKRKKDYEFSWENALQSQGDSGIRLQYLHCRLWSLEQNCGVGIPSLCQPEFLKEPEAIILVSELARFDDVVERARDEMEASILVFYLFQLSKTVNRAFKVLQVKGQGKDLAEQRLLLFHSARLVIKKSLEILGVKPLNQM